MKKNILKISAIILCVLFIAATIIYIKLCYTDERAIDAYIEFYNEFYEKNASVTDGENRGVFDCGARLIYGEDEFQMAVFDVEKCSDKYCDGNLYIFDYFMGTVRQKALLTEIHIANQMGDSTYGVEKATVSNINGDIYFDYIFNEQNVEFSTKSGAFQEVPKDEKVATIKSCKASSIMLMAGEKFLSYLGKVRGKVFLDECDFMSFSAGFLSENGLFPMEQDTTITSTETDMAEYLLRADGNLTLTSLKNYNIEDKDVAALFEPINGRMVTGIDNGVFSRCTKLVNVDIPEGVNSIGTGIFKNIVGNAESVKTVQFPSTFTDFRSEIMNGRQDIIIYTTSGVLYEKAWRASYKCVKGERSHVNYLDDIEYTKKCRYLFLYNRYKDSGIVDFNLNYKYVFVNMDNDEYPELVEKYNNILRIYTYKEGKVESVYYSDENRDFYGWLDSKYFYINNSSYTEEYIVKLRGKELDTVIKHIIYPYYGTDFYYGEYGNSISYKKAVKKMNKFGKASKLNWSESLENAYLDLMKLKT